VCHYYDVGCNSLKCSLRKPSTIKHQRNTKPISCFNYLLLWHRTHHWTLLLFFTKIYRYTTIMIFHLNLIVLICIAPFIVWENNMNSSNTHHSRLSSRLSTPPPLKLFSISNYLSKMKEATIQWKAIITTANTATFSYTFIANKPRNLASGMWFLFCLTQTRLNSTPLRESWRHSTEETHKPTTTLTLKELRNLFLLLVLFTAWPL